MLACLGLAVALLLCLLADMGKRDEACMLCGKGRTVRTFSIPRRDMRADAYANDYSEVLEPLVHSGGSAHQWHVYRDKSLLGRARDAMRRFPWTGSHESWWVQRPEAVQSVCRWDPELGVAVGQYLLSYSMGMVKGSRRRDDLLFQILMVFDIPSPLRDSWFNWYDMAHLSADRRESWNEMRRMFGLPDLSPEEMDALIAKHTPASE